MHISDAVLIALESAHLDIIAVQQTAQPDHFVVELAALPGDEALKKRFLDANFNLIGWRSDSTITCLIQDVAYTVERIMLTGANRESRHALGAVA